eukprot:766215-Hanusia_phi.AAC.1
MRCELRDRSELCEQPQGRVAAPDAEVEGERELERSSDLLRVFVEELLEPRVDEANDADPREGEDKTSEHEPQVPRWRLERVAEHSAHDGQAYEERVGDLVGEVERPQQVERLASSAHVRRSYGREEERILTRMGQVKT